MNKRAILTIWPGTTTSNKEAKMSFEPTYEELKHPQLEGYIDNAHRFWAYLWGIETIITKNFRIIWTYSFEPTYEELKLIISYIPIVIELWVLSLPMRNWNWSLRIEYPFRYQVLSLPMRNWNSSDPNLAFSDDIEFWAYLWGIETPSKLTRLTRTGYVLSLPMRNWN